MHLHAETAQDPQRMWRWLPFARRLLRILSDAFAIKCSVEPACWHSSYQTKREIRIQATRPKPNLNAEILKRTQKAQWQFSTFARNEALSFSRWKAWLRKETRITVLPGLLLKCTSDNIHSHCLGLCSDTLYKLLATLLTST